ncbi:hypothetical protein EDD64_110108 [Effusibacillus lacus]|nr:hypothetical protein EDD64_110108 [Effusibacillus lacus]
MKKLLALTFVTTMAFGGTAFAAGSDVAECAASDQCPVMK